MHTTKIDLSKIFKVNWISILAINISLFFILIFEPMAVLGIFAPIIAIFAYSVLGSFLAFETLKVKKTTVWRKTESLIANLFLVFLISFFVIKLVNLVLQAILFDKPDKWLLATQIFSTFAFVVMILVLAILIWYFVKKVRENRRPTVWDVTDKLKIIDLIYYPTTFLMLFLAVILKPIMFFTNGFWLSYQIVILPVLLSLIVANNVWYAIVNYKNFHSKNKSKLDVKTFLK
ncbi:hypothetical protein [Mycoplasma sp. 4044]